MTRILCAAIWFADGKEYPHQPVNIHTGFVISGHRHHNCLATASALINDHDYYKTIRRVQGFLTSDNQFVDREVAAEIAIFAGQTDKPIERLFSENLY